MRLIDADELKQKIDTMTIDFVNYKINLEAVYSAIRYAPTVGEWVSVKDRLPDHSCTVLTYHDYGGMQVLDYSMKHKLFNCHDWNKKAELDSIKIESVTHWQPLPEPPEEVAEE